MAWQPADLAERVRQEFPFGKRAWPWGTTRGTLAEAVGIEATRGAWVDAFGASLLGGIELLDGAVFGPSAMRPVLQASYRLGVDVSRDSDLRSLIGDFAGALGEAEVREHALRPYGDPAGQVRTAAVWQVGPVSLTISAWHGVRKVGGAASTGGLFLRHDEVPLAEPYLAEYEAPDAPWREGASEDRVMHVAAPGLAGPASGLPGAATADAHCSIAFLVIFRSYLRAAPAWAVSGLAPEALCLWSHPRGYAGVADARSTWVTQGSFADARFELHRVGAAKGPGYATLYAGRHERIASTEPGDAGLDAVAAALGELGAEVRVERYADC